VQNSDNKTRRRQRDGSSPIASQETLVTSRVQRTADASLKAGISSIEQNRASNANDRGRRGGVSSLHSSIEHLIYKSDNDSEDEKINKSSSNSSSSSRHHSTRIETSENERSNPSEGERNKERDSRDRGSRSDSRGSLRNDTIEDFR
jgi:hypothetical protein